MTSARDRVVTMLRAYQASIQKSPFMECVLETWLEMEETLIKIAAYTDAESDFSLRAQVGFRQKIADDALASARQKLGEAGG